MRATDGPIFQATTMTTTPWDTTETAIETPKKIRGFHEDHELPYRIGDLVIIPAGTTITGMGKIKRRIASRAFKIRINHFICGRSFCIGIVGSDGVRRHMALYRTDEDLVVKRYGKSSKELLDRPDVKIRDRYLHLPIDNPTVRWPGSGGYWQEVDINDVRSAPAPKK